MITIRDLYNVLSAVVPLYVAMILAYGSVKWWKIFTPDQCSGINRFVALFAVPLLSFDFISKNDPFNMNFRFLAADSLAKVLILVVLLLWVRFSKSGSLEWMITLFSLASLPNTLVMGIPLLSAMYGEFSGVLMVQIVVLQCIIWYTLLLFLFEYRGARNLISEQFPETAASIVSFKVESDVISLDGREPLQTEAAIGDDGKIHVTVRKSISSRSVISSRRSQGLTSLPSSKALTPRPSNMTGAEIYSLHSSRNPTPRGSSFNHTDFYSMLAGRPMSPRQSNFAHSDVYSLHSSRGPTPRTSNFDEENSKDLNAFARGTANMASPRFPAPLYSSGGYMYGGRNPAAMAGNYDLNPSGIHGSAGVNAASQTGYPGSNVGVQQSGYPGSNAGIMSPNASRQARKTADPKATPKLNEDAKELHMFVWSSSASPVSEGGLHVFGGRDFSTVDNARAEHNAKEVRMLVVPSNETTSAAAGVPEARESYDDYVREDFSFGNRALSQEECLTHDKEGPSLSKLGSSSTAELTPMEIGDKKPKEMPPATVMTKLILVMVWRKLIRNPNTYSSLLGVIWSLVASRWGIAMPKIVRQSISILSNAGLGMAMFSLGLFMALQPRIIACGNSVAAFGMAVRFLTGPAVMAASSIIVGVRGVLLHVAIVQAALPQGIVPFVFAKEYNVHPDILSTGVIFGMLIALPITLLYYFLLGL